MLAELLIRNLAIIDEVQLPLRPGFNVLTGETGAGKSIIIQALTFLVGGRADIELIRTGADYVLTEAVFDLSRCPQVKPGLNALGVELEEETLILSREFNRAGRSRCRINGRATTLAMLKQVGKLLMEIHGQHEHQSLLDPSAHLHFLDTFGGEEIAALKDRYGKLYRDFIQGKRELTQLRQSERDRMHRLDLLCYQADEIDKANLRDGEEEELAQERKILINAERITEKLKEAVKGLMGERGALDTLGEAIEALKDIADIDLNLQRWHETLTQAFDTIQEIGFDLERYLSRVEFDPQRLEEVENRLDLIRRLKRKYGDTIASILRYREQIEEEIQGLKMSEERIEALERRLNQLRTELADAADALSKARQQYAQRLEKTILSHLKALMMERARFKVMVERLPSPDGLPLPEGAFAFTREGIDQVEFLIATNPGEPLKPLAKVASGGELARTMLALKASLQRAHEIPVLIFDEVDVGIGGRTAEAVGEKLREVSRYAQVICVTHLPQIASLANWHLRVEKVIEGRRTSVFVSPLEGESRVQELARMLSGKKITPASLRHAQELLERSASLSR